MELSYSWLGLHLSAATCTLFPDKRGAGQQGCTRWTAGPAPGGGERNHRERGPDLLVQVGLGLLTLDRGVQAVDVFLSMKALRVLHSVVSLQSDNRSPSQPSEGRAPGRQISNAGHAVCPLLHPALSPRTQSRCRVRENAAVNT